MNHIFKRSHSSFMMLFIALFSFAYSFGQTTLISPTGDGGFENGATFAANGWIASNSANNPWIVGPFTNGVLTGNGAFVSNDGTTPSYSNSSISTNYFWRDVTVPAGQTKINLKFDWASEGENSYDLWQVFVAPTSVTPVGSTASLGFGTTSVPSAISGATYVANGSKMASTVQSVDVYLPASLAGTTFRLIFHWKNDGGGGTEPPAHIDNISLVSSLPGNFISITTGNWGSATTWDANAVPTSVDNVTVSTGDVVTIDATNQTANNLIINGTLTYGTTPATFDVNENLTINFGGVFNVFNGTAGKKLSVAKNITNNGTIDLSVGTTTSGNLTLNGTTVQTVSGTGTFSNGFIRNLTFSNTSTVTPNINWSINNSKVAYNLNVTGARINLGTNKLTFGNNAAGNTLTAANGSGFLSGGKFSRYYAATGTGSTITAGSDPTATASKYPFVSANGDNRSMFITRSNTTGAVAGELAVTYNDATTVTSGLSIVDGAYTVTDRYDGNWSVSDEGTPISASSYKLAIVAQNAYIPANGNSRIIGVGAAISGTHQNGTTTPGVQRILVTQADLLAGPLYIGIDALDIPFVSVSTGNWNNPATWNKGTVPTCTDAIVIANGHNVIVNSAGNVSKNIIINVGGTLTVASGDLEVGCTMNNNSLVNNGTLTVSNGTLNINGNMLHNAASTFNQSGGDIIVDGNDAGNVATSVASGVSIVQLNSEFINWTGGTLTIVDPHASTSASNTIAYTNSIAHVNVPNTHTLKLGNGVSTDAGGNATNGYRLNTYASSNRILFGNLEVNTLVGTNRHVTTTYALGFSGNLTIEPGSEVIFATSYVAGNVVNNGTFTSTTLVGLANFLDGTASAVTDPQTISGSGIFKNSNTTVTANLSSFTVNNSNATGVTLNVPLSVSGTLNMTSGIINTTNANLLTLGTGTATGTLSGTPSPTNMVRGPFARTIANSNTGFITFPVGKSNYSPISFAPTTTVASVMKAEAFDANTGTADAAITNLSPDRRWEVATVSGDYTDISVRLGDDLIIAANIPVQAPTAAGIYTSSFGSIATFTAGTPNTVESLTPIAASDFTGFLSFAESNVCMGTPTPGNTIASATTICLGESVTFTPENLTVGTGVTYQWKSSTDGITYTAMVGETNQSLTTLPSDASYYLVDVTCATGPATGTSTPIQINFSSSITASTPATRCGTGTVVLAATPSTGATVSWYANPIGGTALGTGTSFTSPSISATTTYYAAPATSSTGNVAIGTGTSLTSSSSQVSIFCNYWSDGWKQMVYTAAELNAAGLSAGNITSITFNTASMPDAATVNNFAVRIGATSNTVLTGFTTSGLALSFGPVNYTPVVGLNTLTLSTPYNWDGVSNILIDIREEGQYDVGNSTTYFTSTVTNSVVYTYNSSSTLNPNFYTSNPFANVTNTRPNIIFNGQSSCSGVRVPVVATVTTPPTITLSSASEVICAGQSTPSVTLTAGSTDYDTYTWSPATGVSGDEVSGYVFNPTTTTTYTLTAAQTAGALCATTVDFVVNVNTLPTPLVVTPATASICADATQVLTATGATIGLVGKVGTGTSTNITSTPFKSNWGGSKTQSLYTAAELTGMGMIAGEKVSSIGWIALTSNPNPLTDFTISAGFVSASNLGTTFIGGATTTVLAPASYTVSSIGNVDFTLSTPLLWDGVSNLLVETCFNNNNGGAGSSSSVESTSLSTGFCLYASADNDPTFCANPSSTSTTTTRPNLRISTLESTNITWSPVTDLYTDAAATVAYVAGTNAATVYVKSPTVGTLTYTVSGTNPTTLCASTTTANVTVNANTTNTTTEVACGTFTWAVNGATYTTSGTYTFQSGCVTEELILTINPATTNTTTEVACDSYTWAVNGTVYTTSGTYTEVTGCDTEELVLTITPTSTNTTTEVACETYTWAVNGTVYTTSGTYTEVVGCVTEILDLTINPSTSNLTTETACDTYTWAVDGVVYTTSGTYVSINGCVTDSLVLTITPSTTNTTTETSCDTYTWAVNGTTYTASGTYNVVTGCATEVLNLTVNASPVTTITRTGDDLSSDAAGATSYQWGRCDGPFTAIAGATSQTYKPTMVGKYAVRIIKNGCEVTSECFDVTSLDVKTLDIANLNIYPNPVTDALTVTYTKVITGVQVYDVAGRLIKTINTNAKEVSVDMSEMPAALYIVKVISENISSEIRVVKN